MIVGDRSASALLSLISHFNRGPLLKIKDQGYDVGTNTGVYQKLSISGCHQSSDKSCSVKCKDIDSQTPPPVTVGLVRDGSTE